jgi:lactoylglutathione lyase
LPKGRKQPADDGCHFVFDSGRSRSAPSSFLIIDNETEIEGPFLDFRDPWGDPIEIVDYENIQFTKAPNVLRGKGL